MFIDIVHKYGDEFTQDVWPTLPDSQYSNFASLILYCFIRDQKPKKVFELGTEKFARSTYIIQKALLKNGEEFTHYMCDFEPILNQAYRNLFDTTGCVLLNGPIETLEFDYKEIDFLFIDAHHEKWFAGFYLDEIVPQLAKGVPVHVHDVYLSKDWEHRFPYVICETQEFQERHKARTLSVEKEFWMEDYCMNEEYKDIRNELAEKFPFIGGFPAPELPYGDGTTYWRVKGSSIEEGTVNSLGVL